MIFGPGCNSMMDGLLLIASMPPRSFTTTPRTKVRGDLFKPLNHTGSRLSSCCMVILPARLDSIEAALVVNQAAKRFFCVDEAYTEHSLIARWPPASPPQGDRSVLWRAGSRGRAPHRAERSCCLVDTPSGLDYGISPHRIVTSLDAATSRAYR